VKKFWKFFLSLSKYSQITLVILIFHIILILLGFTDYLLTQKNQRKQAMVIRTIKPIRSSPPPTPPKTVLRPKESKIIAPSEQKRPITIKTPKKEKREKENIPQLNQEILHELQKSLESLSASPAIQKNTPTLSLPKEISIKTEIKSNSTSNSSYTENLLSILTKNLDLPEFGAVKAAIEIDALGSVIQVRILEEKSHKNSEFLKKRLRELTFPCFNEFGLSEKRMEFVITFLNLEH